MIARTATASRETGIDAHLGKLAECDESLSLIASDVRGLLDELTLLRAGTDHLLERQAEQSALLAEKELALSRLESERSQACRRADEGSAALLEARTRLSEREGRARSLADELQELQDTVADRNDRLAEAQGELERIRAALAEREATPRRDRALPEPLHGDAERGSRCLDSRHEPAPVALPIRPIALPRQGGPDPAARAPATGHLRFAPFPEGYRLTASDERCSRPGDLIEVDGQRFLVTRVGRSPLPDDERPCAFLLPDTTPPVTGGAPDG